MNKRVSDKGFGLSMILVVFGLSAWGCVPSAVELPRNEAVPVVISRAIDSAGFAYFSGSCRKQIGSWTCTLDIQLPRDTPLEEWKVKFETQVKIEADKERAEFSYKNLGKTGRFERVEVIIQVVPVS